MLEEESFTYRCQLKLSYLDSDGEDLSFKIDEINPTAERVTPSRTCVPKRHDTWFNAYAPIEGLKRYNYTLSDACFKEIVKTCHQQAMTAAESLAADFDNPYGQFIAKWSLRTIGLNIIDDIKSGKVSHLTRRCAPSVTPKYMNKGDTGSYIYYKSGSSDCKRQKERPSLFR